MSTTIYEIRNAGGVLLGWGKEESVVRAQAEITAADHDIDVVVKEVEQCGTHGPSEEIVKAI